MSNRRRKVIKFTSEEAETKGFYQLLLNGRGGIAYKGKRGNLYLVKEEDIEHLQREGINFETLTSQEAYEEIRNA